MKNAEHWKPTKYEYYNGRLYGSRDVNNVSVSSRLICDRVANCYESALPNIARGDLLDLGCGQAPLYHVYQPLVDTVTCVDWPSSLHDIRFADILCDVNSSIPIPDSSFDTIICSDVLEHLHSPSKTLLEIARLLRPGGRLLLNVPFIYCLHEEPHDYFRYTKHGIQNLCNAAGLNVLQMHELGGALDVLCDITAKQLAQFAAVGPPLASLHQFTWNCLRKINFFKSLDLRTAKIFPLEYFAIATLMSPKPINS